MGTHKASSITVAPLGDPALSALSAAIADAKAGDPFRRVVVIADDRDVARKVLHLLGAEGLINVTVQTGERLAAELARPVLHPTDGGAERPPQPLTPLHETQAVRRVADAWLDDGPAGSQVELSAAGRLRLYGELTRAFRQMEQRADAIVDEPPAGGASLDLPRLYQDFCHLLRREGFYTRNQLPRLAARALSEHWADNEVPAVAYYLPRHPEAGELELMQYLLELGKARVIVGLAGDETADEPAGDLLRRLGNAGTREPDDTPLKLAAEADRVSIVVTPDPTEEVRAVVRRIAAMADDVPFHSVAVVHRQEAPYASLLRQELEFAGIPSSGVPRRTLAETAAGRFLLGGLGLVREMAGGGDAPSIDRELWIELITSVPINIPSGEGDGGRANPVEVPATRWANLARASRANGAPPQWTARLRAYVIQQDRREAERFGDRAPNAGTAADYRRSPTGDPGSDALVDFLDGLAGRLLPLRGTTGTTWRSAVDSLKTLLKTYLQRVPGDEQDYGRIEELLDGLPALQTWNDAYSLEILSEAVSEGLQSPVSDRGRPVGSGVYVGPPAGIVGTRYQTVFVMGMVEGQFPPAHRVSSVDEWLADGGAAHTQRALERYEFLGAIAAADRAILSYPVAGADRRGTYPSRWLLETANLLQQRDGAQSSDRITSENLAEDAGNKPWLTVVPSRETGLRRLAAAMTGASAEAIAPADAADYNLAHLLPTDRGELSSHRAWLNDAHMARALDARRARRGATLSPWDGLVASGSTRITDIGAPNRPVSPSALETWATCPYRYFLSRVLGLAAPPGADDEVEMSPLDRGSLVHRVLEEFVKQGRRSEGELLELADVAFAEAEGQGITGYPLLWEMEKEAIREGLRAFRAADAGWLGEGVSESHAEVPFDEVDVEVDELGIIRFRGKIDRLDVVGSEVRVRDFKTGRPDSYRSGPTTRNAYTVANGRALQLPVYVEAARRLHPNAEIRASYCFPLSDNPAEEARPYTEAAGRAEFHETLRKIIGSARSGVFPATPDGEGDYSVCRYCDFNRLCPTRRRQIWERKGRQDRAAQRFNALGGRSAVSGGGNDD